MGLPLFCKLSMKIMNETSFLNSSREFSSITLPQVTITEYSSTYFITRYISKTWNDLFQPLPVLTLYHSGTPRPINKRNASPAVKDNSTPSALSTCARETISEACSSIVKPTTTTATITSTRFTCTTTTSLTTTIPNHEITATYPLTLSPPPIIILAPSTVTLTTTVPVDCVGPTYNSNASLGIGNTIVYAEYPYFPQTPVECCILCWSLPNCVASAFIPDALECEMLVQINGSEGVGVSSICPLGVEDYPFGFVDPDSNVLPGPCGM